MTGSDLSAARVPAWAQSTAVRRIGMIVSGSENDQNTQERITAFRQALDALGWSEGRNVHIEYRYSEGKPERFPQFAREMAALGLIFAWTTPAIKALQQATRTITARAKAPALGIELVPMPINDPTE